MATRPKKTDEERVKDIDIKDSVTLITKTLINNVKRDIKMMTPKERGDLLTKLLPYTLDKNGEVSMEVKVSMADLIRKYNAAEAAAKGA